MSLRKDVAKLSQKATMQAKESQDLRQQIQVLEKKNASDCTIILNQVKDLESMAKAQKQAKSQIKKLQS